MCVHKHLFSAGVSSTSNVMCRSIITTTTTKSFSPNQVKVG
jgi:hypothetical protein